MNKAIHPQYITDEQGKRVSVVFSMQQWQQLLDELDELDDIRLYDAVKLRNEPTTSLADYRSKRAS
ncbi:hypothetical protein [uncultured Spirosoma sp.]|uniref:hypothetical protein n=1 Tax=uncultured Spirosoma sp. TaxID=278208 RepID=UPI0025867A03|nr:hypothetical protein [uncultured Spirosoma sp.]